MLDGNIYSGGVLYVAGYIHNSTDTRFKTYVATSITSPPTTFVVSETWKCWNWNN